MRAKGLRRSGEWEVFGADPAIVAANGTRGCALQYPRLFRSRGATFFLVFDYDHVVMRIYKLVSDGGVGWPLVVGPS